MAERTDAAVDAAAAAAGQTTDQSHRHLNNRRWRHRPANFNTWTASPTDCPNCGWTHRTGNCTPATFAYFYECGAHGHFARCCMRSSQRYTRSPAIGVRAHGGPRGQRDMWRIAGSPAAAVTHSWVNGPNSRTHAMRYRRVVQLYRPIPCNLQSTPRQYDAIGQTTKSSTFGSSRWFSLDHRRQNKDRGCVLSVDFFLSWIA